MGKVDTKKVYKRALDIYEMCVDDMPSKDQRKQKRKERQSGKKEIREELKIVEKKKA